MRSLPDRSSVSRCGSNGSSLGWWIPWVLSPVALTSEGAVAWAGETVHASSANSSGENCNPLHASNATVAPVKRAVSGEGGQAGRRAEGSRAAAFHKH